MAMEVLGYAKSNFARLWAYLNVMAHYLASRIPGQLANGREKQIHLKQTLYVKGERTRFYFFNDLL